MGQKCSYKQCSKEFKEEITVALIRDQRERRRGVKSPKLGLRY